MICSVLLGGTIVTLLKVQDPSAKRPHVSVYIYLTVYKSHILFKITFRIFFHSVMLVRKIFVSVLLANQTILIYANLFGCQCGHGKRGVRGPEEARSANAVLHTPYRTSA